MTLKLRLRKPPARVLTKYTPFKGYKHIDSARDVLVLAKRDSKLKKAIDLVFNKKTAVGTVAATVGGVAYENISRYVKNHSGCFLYENGVKVCKVKELSCCQPEDVYQLANCNFPLAAPNACDGFDENVEQTCCRDCDCQLYDCQPGQELKCHRSNVAEALSHFSSAVGQNVWSSTLVKMCVTLLSGMPFLWLLSLLPRRGP